MAKSETQRLDDAMETLRRKAEAWDQLEQRYAQDPDGLLQRVAAQRGWGLTRHDPQQQLTDVVAQDTPDELKWMAPTHAKLVQRTLELAFPYVQGLERRIAELEGKPSTDASSTRPAVAAHREPDPEFTEKVRGAKHSAEAFKLAAEHAAQELGLDWDDYNMGKLRE